MKRFLLLVGLTAFSHFASAAAPSWDELQAAVQASDSERLQGWVSQNGLESNTAANALIAAAMAGHRPMLDKLLALGIPINLTNYYGSTALIKAADVGNTTMVRYLLQRGAKANAAGRCHDVGCKGHTALMGAACKQDLEMARALLEAGANPRAANDAATETANKNGDVELFLLLEQFGGRERPAQAGKANSASARQTVKGTIPIAALGLTELLPGKATSETSSAAKGKSRLSVVADESNLLLGDLLSARLSTEPSLELIERQELDRVLSEQKLTRQFATDAANYGRVASLLQADALLLIHTRQVSGTKVVESRLIRVNPGLALDTAYSSLPIGDAPKWAERMGARVVSLAAKVTRQDAIALSLLSIRTSVSSSADHGLDQSIAVLLSDRLAHQAHFVLLERAVMERMALENTGRFWTGSYLVDGAIEPALDGSGAFTLSVRFQPAGRGEALTFTSAGRRSNPAQAIDDLLLKINSGLTQSPPPQRRDLADEAQRYLEEAKWALAADQSALAQSAAEAAWALGARSSEVARLRVLTAMFTVRDLRHQPERKQDTLGPAGWLDLALHGLTTWRETLEGELLQGRPDELRKWLEFGLETVDGALFVIFQINTAAEQVRQARRLEMLRETLWEVLEEAGKRSAGLPSGHALANQTAEKQAVVARLIFPRTAEFLPAARNLLSRHFHKDDALTRARIRANLIRNWDITIIPSFRYGRNSSGSASMGLSRGDEASYQLAKDLRQSSAPEDRYLAALLAMKRATLRREWTPADIERLCSSLLDLSDLLAEGGEIFQLYFEPFDSLDNLDGVPFFALTRHESGNRMWERHTPEHSEFRRKLFQALLARAKKPDPQFQRMLSRDDFTPEQQAEMAAAQGRVGTRAPASVPMGPSPVPRGAVVTRSRTSEQPPNPSPAPPTDDTPPLRVSRLWHPFNLGLAIPPEVQGDWGSMQWEEGRLWLHATTLTPGGRSDRHFVFSIDAATMRTETVEVSQPADILNARFKITPNYLVFALRDYLGLFDRAQKRWDIYGEIKPAVLVEPLLVGECVYLAVAEPPGNAVISFNLNTRATEILASTRRRPAISPFDDPNVQLGSVTTNEANEIVVTAGKLSHIWSPAHRNWRPVPPSKSSSPRQRTPGYGRVGAVRQLGDALVLRLNRKDAQPIDIPLRFALPAGFYLPESRYGPQRIWPRYCNSFAAGLLLVPHSGSGFWVIPQQELDDYLSRRTAMSKSAESAAN